MVLLSTAVMAVVNIIDSHLISKRTPSLQAFMLPLGFILLTNSLVLMHLFPLPENVSTQTIAVAVASGIARSSAALIMFYTLRKEEVSRVVPVVYTYPIFVAIMAMLFLGESLSGLNWLAISIVVSGAILISLRPGLPASTKQSGKTFLLLFVASLFFAIADVASKYALGDISAWNLLWIVMLCLSIILFILSLRPSTFTQWRQMKQRKPTIALFVSESFLAFIGVALLLSAIEQGPVSLVSTIAGSRPAFVLAFAFILSHSLPDFLNWEPGKRMMALRLTATAMIVGGIAIINLT